MEVPIFDGAPSTLAEDLERVDNYRTALEVNGIKPFSRGGEPPPPRARTKPGSKTHRDQCGICGYSGRQPVGGAFRLPFKGRMTPDTPRRSTRTRKASDCPNVCRKCYDVDKPLKQRGVQRARVSWLVHRPSPPCDVPSI